MHSSSSMGLKNEKRFIAPTANLKIISSPSYFKINRPLEKKVKTMRKGAGVENRIETSSEIHDEACVYGVGN